MNNEQNIDDILKLLKSSYNEGDGDEKALSADTERQGESVISHEELQDRLKRQFMSGENEDARDSEDGSDEFSYSLDDSILAGAEEEEDSDAEPEQEIVIESESEPELAAKAETEDVVDTLLEEAVSAEEQEEREDDDGIPPFDLEPDSEGIEALLALLNDKNASTEDESALDDEIFEDADDEIFVENEDGEIVLVKAENIDKASAVEDILSESKVREQEDIELFSDESGQLAIFDMAEEPEGNEEELAAVSQQSYDELQLAMDFGESCAETDEYSDLADNTVVEETDESIDDSVLGLMLEFGDVSALENSVGSERVDEYINRTQNKSETQIDPSEAFAFDGNEYEAAEQREELMAAYGREKLFTGLRILGCAVFTALLFVYELVSALEIEMPLVPDYVDYPAVYMLVGMQLFVFSAAFAWRELLSGLKKAFSFKADRWSSVAVVCLFVLLHGTATAFIPSARVLYTFGTVASLYILIGLIFEYIEVCREIKCFDVYSSEQVKFTVSTKAASGSCAEKMYRGGVPREKRIFEPRRIDFPRGYFSAVNLSGRTDKLIVYSIAPSIIMAAVALVVCAMLGYASESALAAFTCVVVSLCPISSFAIHTALMYKTSSYLHSRGSAVAGEVMALGYAECDYIVFGDMHLFKRASAEDNGIVIYDERNSATIVGYLDALYSTIGGPMSEIFGGVSGGKHTVKLRRIAKNGVEAALDGNHSLILGDAEFCRRYGIVFEGMENSREGDGILGFAVDGRPAAKLCCRYKCEPIFEMLIEKMGENGIRCAIETYDPAINSAFAAACRKDKSNPVNVIHKNVTDYYRGDEGSINENTGLVSCASRLKLVESIIWCKHLSRALKICSVFQYITYGLICALLTVLVAFDLIGGFNQYYLLLAQALTMLPTFAAALIGFPKKNYFSA